jgi:hypothetical protein
MKATKAYTIRSVPISTGENTDPAFLMRINEVPQIREVASKRNRLSEKNALSAV